MESKEFLRKRLQAFANQFESIQLSYFFDDAYSQHVIAVSPKGKYAQNEFAKAQMQFELEFINHFPYESLYFVDKAEIEITNEIEFEVKSENVLLDVINLGSRELFESLFTEIGKCTYKKVDVSLSLLSQIADAGMGANNNEMQLTQVNKSSTFGDESAYAMAA